MGSSSPSVALRNSLTHETDPQVLRRHAQDPRSIVSARARLRMKVLGIPEVEPVVVQVAADRAMPRFDLERYWLPEGADPEATATCTRCGAEGYVLTQFGYRRMTGTARIRAQAQCRRCRSDR